MPFNPQSFLSACLDQGKTFAGHGNITDAEDKAVAALMHKLMGFALKLQKSKARTNTTKRQLMMMIAEASKPLIEHGQPPIPYVRIEPICTALGFYSSPALPREYARAFSPISFIAVANVLYQHLT